jgi:hypothetical protein
MNLIETNQMSTKSIERGTGLLGWLIPNLASSTAPRGMQDMIPAPEYSALVDLYNGTGGSAWLDNSGWLDPQTDPGVGHC